MNDDEQTAMSRRSAIGTLGLAGLAPVAVFSGAALAATPAGDLGWDEKTGRYTLPPLPYAYDALEPALDTQTMTLHHDKHHAGYVRGLNKALDHLAQARNAGDFALVKHWSREVAFHGSGHLNHTLFWTGMAPAHAGGGGEPAGALAETIRREFGSFAAFTKHYAAASKAVEGSGWGWLAYEPLAGRLIVTQAEKHQNLAVTGAVPLLGVDVWEHAYYLRYQNRRAEYIKAFLSVVNWPEIGRRFDAARAALR